MNALFWVAVGLAGAEWIAIWRGWKQVTYVTKPGMMVALIAWFIDQTWLLKIQISSNWTDPAFWFAFGLVASLVGDVLLMLPSRFFLPGLVAFLFAHIFYLVGFNLVLPDPTPLLFIPAALVVVAAVIVFRSILRGLNRSPGSRMMRVPVTIYATVISLMLYSALISFWRSNWDGNPLAVLMASLGAFLFWLSDSTLATGKFVRPSKWGDLIVMITYQLGQIALAVGVSLAFGPMP